MDSASPSKGQLEILLPPKDTTPLFKNRIKDSPIVKFSNLETTAGTASRNLIKSTISEHYHPRQHSVSSSMIIKEEGIAANYGAL
jgi:hypothetical protein